jgi:PAS domain S-box-containing protein
MTITWTWEAAAVAAAAALLLVAAGVAVAGVRRTRRARRNAEASALAYRRSARRLRRLLDASPVAHVVIDRESNVRLWTSAAEALFGWPEREVLGLPVPMVTTDKLAEWRRIREFVAEGNSLYGLETTQRSRDGRLLEVSLSAVPAGAEIVLTVTPIEREVEQPRARATV